MNKNIYTYYSAFCFNRSAFKKLYKLLFSLFLLFGLSTYVCGQRYTEYELKAAYLFNFAKFVEWPDSIFKTKESPMILGIYDGDPFGDIIDKTFSGRAINNRKWIIKYFKDIDKIENCHILFIARIDKVELIKVLSIIKNKSILSVGDNIKDFCQLGGMINFAPQYSKYRFEINNSETIKVKLIVSSKLLILSKIIKTNEIKF